MKQVRRDTDEKTEPQLDPSSGNSMNVVDEDRARQKLAEKVEDDDKDIVDIEPSDSYSVATKLREQFRDFLDRS